jgi:hypothetical protein
LGLPGAGGGAVEGVHQFLWYMDCDYKEQTETILFKKIFHLDSEEFSFPVYRIKVFVNRSSAHQHVLGVLQPAYFSFRTLQL